MAFCTSLPELLVGLNAAFHKIPQLSFGNIIGANILNLSLGLGLVAFLAGGLKVKRRVAQQDSFLAVAIGILPLILILNKQLGRIDGIILILVFIFYVRRLWHQENKNKKILSVKAQIAGKDFKSFLKHGVIFFLSALLLILSAELVVRSGQFFVSAFNLAPIVVGALILALGTSLPETIFGIRSARMNHKAMAIGNQLGSVIINSTLILGLVALVHPIQIVNFSPYFIGIIFTLIVALFFTNFIKSRSTISIKEAGVLILIYLVFVLFEIFYK